VRTYESAQQFYAVPYLYTNETKLGMWLEGGDRYGSSSNRKNNFTPLLTNEFSSGPFGFQSEFRTGAGPLLQSIHEESQTQAYYRLKADYFHFTGFVDPNLLLVGGKYKWQPADLGPHDIRANESAFIEFGFDYGKFAVEFYSSGAVNIGAQEGSLFNNGTIGGGRVGLRYQSHSWLLNVIGGGDGGSGFNLSMYRANAEWVPDNMHRFVFSLLQRQLKFTGLDSNAVAVFSSEADSTTAAAWGYWRFKTRYWFGLMMAVESVKEQYGAPSLTNSENRVFPKAGAMMSLAF
jgi:hypothetical protein